jgi:ComEC/Rec2-related protein
MVQLFLFLSVCLGLAVVTHMRLAARALPVPAVTVSEPGARVQKTPATVLQVTALPDFRGRGWRLDACLLDPSGGFPAGRKLCLWLPAVAYHDLRLPRVGDTLRIRDAPKPYRPPRHPFLMTPSDRLTPYRRVAFLRLDDWQRLENHGDSGRYPVRRLLDGARRWVHCRIIAAGREHPAAAGVLAALLVGTRDALPPETQAVFADLGVSHLLAISGLHVGLVAGFVFFLVARCALLLPGGRLVRGAAPPAALVAIPCCWAFVAWTGAALPAVRAGIMATCLLAAVWLDRGDDPWSALLLAVAIIMVCWPESLFRPSFRMSVAAVVGILLFMRNYDRLLPSGSSWRGGWRRRLALSAGVSTAAWLATAPWAASAFHCLALWAIPVNILLVPIFSLTVLPVALGSLLLLPLPPLYDLLVGFLAAVLDHVLAAAGQVLGLLPHPVFSVGALSASWIMFYYILLVALGGLLCRCRKALFTMLAGVAVAGLAVDHGIAWRQAQNRDRLEIACFIGGSRQAAVVHLPDGGGNILFNGGTWPRQDFSLAHQVIAPYLYRRHVRRIDAIVLPTPQDGMVGGLDRLVREFAVPEVWYNGIWTGYPPFRSFYDHSRDIGVRWRVLARGARVRQFGAVQIEPLLPDRNQPVAGMSWRDACRQRAVSVGIGFGTARVILWGGAGDPGPADVIIAARTPDESWPLATLKHGRVRVLVAPDVPRKVAASGAMCWSTRRDGFLLLELGRGGELTLNGQPLEGKNIPVVTGAGIDYHAASG